MNHRKIRNYDLRFTTAQLWDSVSECSNLRHDEVKVSPSDSSLPQSLLEYRSFSKLSLQLKLGLR